MSFLTQYISNPVALRDLRQMKRLGVLWPFAIGVFFTTFAIPLWQLTWDSVFMTPPSVTGNTVLEFGGVTFYFIAGTAVLFGLHPAVDFHLPHREFISHGKLTPETLLAGRRQAGWVLLGLGHLATLPCLGLALALGDASVSDYLIAQLLALLMSFVLLELSLGSAAIGAGAILLLLTIGLALSNILFQHLEKARLLDFAGEPSPYDTGTITPFDWLFLALLSGTAFCCTNMANHALLRPMRSNRELPLRAASTVAWVVIALFFAYTVGTVLSSEPGQIVEMILTLGIVTFELMVVGLLPMGLMVDPLPHRVRKEIPKNRWRRWLMYPFFSGPDSNVVWAMGMLAASALAGWGILHSTDQPITAFSSSLKNPFVKASWIVALFILSAAVQMTVLKQNNPKATRDALLKKWAWWIVGAAVVMCLLVASCVGIIEMMPDSNPLHYVFSPQVFGVLLLVQLLRSCKWWLRRWREFKPVDG
jgi:hypothetical protein